MKNRLRVIRIKKFFRKRIIPISILAGVALSIVNICCLSVLYGSISTILIFLVKAESKLHKLCQIIITKKDIFMKMKVVWKK